MEGTRHAGGSLAVTAALLLAGCRDPQARMAEADQARTAQLAQRALVSSSRHRPPLPSGQMRIAVHPGAAEVDDLARWAALSPSDWAALGPNGAHLDLERHSLSSRLEGLNVPGDFGNPPPFKFDALQFRLKTLEEQQLHSGRLSAPASTTLYLHPETPFATLVRILLILDLRTHPFLHFAVRCPAGLCALRVSVPTACAVQGAAKANPPPTAPRPCQAAFVSVSKTGLSWRLGELQEPLCTAVRQWEGCKSLGLEPQPALPDPDPWREVSPETATAPREGGRLVLSGLVRALAGRPQAPPTCGLARVSATGEIPWREIVAVADVLQAHGHSDLSLAVE